MPSLLDRFPLRLLIGTEDCTHLLDNGFSFSNVDPGGFEAASFSVPKDMPETLVGQYVRLDCGLSVAWEGRVAQIQRSLGNRTTITCEGHGAILKEQSAAMIFVDRDMSRWGAASVQRKINGIGSGLVTGDPSSVPDATTGQPSLVLPISDTWATGQIPHPEGWYDAQGVPLGSLYYAWKIAGNVNAADTNWSWAVKLLTDDVGTAFDDSGELRAAGPGSGTLTASSGNRTFAQVRFMYGIAGGTAGAEYDLFFTCLAVYGNHGLTKRGSNSATDAQGFYTSDIAGWVASQVATIQQGNIPDATGYIVKQSAYPVPTPYQSMLADIAKLVGCHWGVWESPAPLTGDQRPRLDFCPYPTAATAWAFRKDCDTLDLNEQLANLYDTAIITFTDTTGVQRSTTVTAANPMLQLAGISGRDVQVDGGTMTPASAQAFGQLILALLLLQARVAGQATFTGTVKTPAGEMPAWMLKAGLDRLRIIDLPGSDAVGTYNDVPVTRVEASGGEEGITTTVELGTGADLTETLQAQLAERAQILGTG